jgi:flagellar biosynthesis anti-sigma factor FlgM
MKVNNPNLSSLGSTEASRAQETARTTTARQGGASQSSSTSGDDVHLSELVRSLRALATNSPERQQHIEQLARTYAGGSYKVDAHSVAGKVIEDAVGKS